MKETARRAVLPILALAGISLLIILSRKYGYLLALPEIDSTTGAGMIFVVGLLAGLHCVGMCGGFIVGYTARDSELGQSSFRSHLLYGSGKILSYAVFGALFGLLGSLFRITPVVGGVSLGIAGAFLIIYGLGTLKLFSMLKAICIRQPQPMYEYIRGRGKRSHSPFFIGILSGFLFGCGPLQAMYVLAAGNGSIVEGAMILALFGLGTLPALLCFGMIARILSAAMTSRFIQASGIILVVMGSIMLSKGLMQAGAVNESAQGHAKCGCMK